MILPGMTLTRGGTFEVRPRWVGLVTDTHIGPYRYLPDLPDLHYRRDRIGD